MAKKEDHGAWIHALDTMFPNISIASVLPPYARKPLLITGLLWSSAREAKPSQMRMVSAAKDCVAERLQKVEKGQSVRQDMLAKLLGIMEGSINKTDKEEFTLDDVQQEAWIALYVLSCFRVRVLDI